MLPRLKNAAVNVKRHASILSLPRARSRLNLLLSHQYGIPEREKDKKTGEYKYNIRLRDPYAPISTDQKPDGSKSFVFRSPLI